METPYKTSIEALLAALGRTMDLPYEEFVRGFREAEIDAWKRMAEDMGLKPTPAGLPGNKGGGSLNRPLEGG